MTAEEIREKLERLIGQTVRLSLSVGNCYVSLPGPLRLNVTEGRWVIPLELGNGAAFCTSDVLEIYNDNIDRDLKVIRIRGVVP